MKILKQKTVFLKATLCIVIVLSMLLSLSSCGSKMDDYKARLDELCESEDSEIYKYYEIDEENGANSFENDFAGKLDVDVIRVISINDPYVYPRAVVMVEFKNDSDAKEYADAYVDAGIRLTIVDSPNNSSPYAGMSSFEFKMQRIKEFLNGEYEGHLCNLFEVYYICERSGNVIVYGQDVEMVEYVVDNVMK